MRSLAVFEEGHELSGGQWQKLAMARTFLEKVILSF